MLLNYKTILETNNDNPFEGVIHIGAHLGEEVVDYVNLGMRHSLWIEANPNIMKSLYDAVKFHPIRFQFLNTVLYNKDGIETNFIICNDTKYSSLLEPTKILLQNGSLQTVSRIPVITKKFETIYRENNSEIDLSKFDFIRVSTNGTELSVLQGFGRLFNTFPFKAISIPFNIEETYNGSCHIEDIDKFLNDFSFKKALTTMSSDNINGEVFYLR